MADHHFDFDIDWFPSTSKLRHICNAADRLAEHLQEKMHEPGLVTSSVSVSASHIISCRLIPQMRIMYRGSDRQKHESRPNRVSKLISVVIFGKVEN